MAIWIHDDGWPCGPGHGLMMVDTTWYKKPDPNGIRFGKRDRDSYRLR